MHRLLKVCLSILSLAGSQVSAQTTPDHVYQTVQGTLHVLEMINEANFSTSKPANTAVEPALPRHVLQLARDVWRKTQLLRFMNGLPTSALEPVPSRQIKPADVKLTVDQIYEQLVGVLPAYGIEDIPELPAITSGKKPTDVFQSLLKLSASLDGLGIPVTVPNDVHQMAATVLQDTLRLAEVAGVPAFDAAALAGTSVSGKTPKDAYDESLILLNELGALASLDRYAIAGGVEPVSQKQSVTPNDVMILLLRARAEVNAMRLALRDTQVSENAEYEGGKTPSDVVYTVMKANAIIRNIAENSRG